MKKKPTPSNQVRKILAIKKRMGAVMQECHEYFRENADSSAAVDTLNQMSVAFEELEYTARNYSESCRERMYATNSLKAAKKRHQDLVESTGE